MTTGSSVVAPSVRSAHNNGCENCFYSRRPDGGHCYMFRDEPRVCFQHKYDRDLVIDAVEGVGHEA